MHLKFLLILLLLVLSMGTSTLQAKTFTYEQIHKMPKSIEKDYYIWRFLSQITTTAAEAKKVIYEASRLNTKLRTAYKNRTGSTIELPKIVATGETNKNWRRRSNAHKSFKHGLALMQQRKPKQAADYFEDARNNYLQRYDIDKSLFWLYLSTKEDKYLEMLRESCDVNIYTLMAADTINGRYPKTITESLWKSSTWGFDIEDPIDWAKVKQKMNSGVDLDDLAEDHKSQETIGIYTYLKAKACNYTQSYFPMPYRKAMKHMTPERQALIYAIARQESRFVPASVSRSFALGMMQFMPFLIEHISKEKGEKIDYDDIFNPYKAIEYADFHLDYLTKYLYHPLFIAYAYNGGIGFTRRHITNKHNFRKGPYEPYMSMEKMENEEAKEYGKKVLANYVIYLNKLGVTTRIFPLLKVLASPSETDKFRK
ncbi:MULTISPECIES: transglycosylase SLT domain-containing protein [Sulfurovum]|uniref:Transglycosylase SLT domain-containing protein n=1 Tax=Sulfurovum xiamenensis TaxID=3019066 RepID=A0ABT7QU57_9BACT|nr:MULTISPECIES: transglycosylase SLT domain-containing protein [Sulfurovum]EIF51431.1 lytic murein transglycosylase [Sulfurovum sp. AR]MDM5264617.1 transglycosylase SLT domain-containing protein [Sulfurovum xiamenensis]